MDMVMGKVTLSLKNYVHSGIYGTFLAPRSTNEDDQRREFILNIILLGSALFLSGLAVVVVIQGLIGPLLGTPYHGIPPVYFFTIYLISNGLFYLSRRGHFEASAQIFIWMYFLGITYGAVRWGPDLYIVILTYALLIVIASIISHIRLGFIVTVATTTVILVLAVLNHQGYITFDQTWKKDQTQVTDTVIFSLTYLMLMFICWLSNRQIGKSLERARESEHALRENNESLEQTIEERTLQLKQSQMEKMSQMYRFVEFGRLSSGVFHDILNPLSVVALNIKELPSQTTPRLQECVDDAVKASRRIEQFMESLKKQVNVESIHERFSCNKEIEDAIRLFAYKARKHNVMVEFEANENLHLTGNPLKFHQIIANLISNALDSYEHVETGGAEDNGEHEKIINLRLTPEKVAEKSFINITVQDNGCGIPAAVLEKIFEPFFTTKKEHTGIGIGLSTTKNIVEKEFGGMIEVSSVEGHGSSFVILIPCEQNQKTH